MAADLLHLLLVVGRLLRPKHVRGRGRGKFPPLQGGAGEGGAGTESGQEGQEDRGEAEK